jgi:hypothetical protein
MSTALHPVAGTEPLAEWVQGFLKKPNEEI